MNTIDTTLFRTINEHSEEVRYQEKRRLRLERQKRERRRQIIIRSIIAVLVLVLPITVLTVNAANNNSEPSEEITIVAETIEPVLSDDVLIEEIVVVEKNDSEITTTPTVEGVEIKESYTYDPYYATSDEIWYYQQVTMAECYSYFSEEEMLMIASAIRNRMEANCFPDDVISVVTQKKQFSVYANGRYQKVTPNQTCKDAVARALEGDTNIPEDIMWFCTVEYFENCPSDDFFKTRVVNVPEYNFQNVMMFKAK